VNELNLIVDKY